MCWNWSDHQEPSWTSYGFSYTTNTPTFHGHLLGHMWNLLEHMSYRIGSSIDKMHFTCIWIDLGCV